MNFGANLGFLASIARHVIFGRRDLETRVGGNTHFMEPICFTGRASESGEVWRANVLQSSQFEERNLVPGFQYAAVLSVDCEKRVYTPACAFAPSRTRPLGIHGGTEPPNCEASLFIIPGPALDCNRTRFGLPVVLAIVVKNDDPAALDQGPRQHGVTQHVFGSMTSINIAKVEAQPLLLQFRQDNRTVPPALMDCAAAPLSLAAAIFASKQASTFARSFIRISSSSLGAP